MAKISPHKHACDAKDCEYGNTVITCNVCGREWTRESGGWRPSPVSKYKPKSQY